MIIDIFENKYNVFFLIEDIGLFQVNRHIIILTKEGKLIAKLKRKKFKLKI